MKRRAALLCCVFLVLAFVGAAAADRDQGRPVPHFISGAMNGTFTFENWGTPDAVTRGAASGTLRHLGEVQLSVAHRPNDADGTLRRGTFRIVDADGAVIWGRYEGAGYFDANGYQVHADAQFVVMGGSGKYAGAKGELNAVFIETFDQYYNCEVAWTVEGVVRY